MTFLVVQIENRVDEESVLQVIPDRKGSPIQMKFGHSGVVQCGWVQVGVDLVNNIIYQIVRGWNDVPGSSD